MKIQKIKIHNFRQFKDATFTFSNKINIIEGENGMGKSTFMASIIFCLHGFEELKKSELLENYDVLYNISNIAKDSDRITEITLYLEIEKLKKQYEVKRTYDSRKSNVVGYNGELEVLEILANKKQNVSSEEIYKWLPKELVPLLFFNGERITSINDVLSGGRQSADFKKQIEGILQIRDYERAKYLLSDANRHINNKRKEQGEDDLITLRNAIDTLKTSKKNRKQMLNKIVLDIEEVNEKIDKIDKYFEENKKSRDLQMKINELKKQKTSVQNKIVNYEIALKKEIPKEMNKEIRNKIYKKIIAEIEKSQTSSHQIPGVERVAIDYILETEKCLCNRGITQTEVMHLEDLKETLPPENFAGYLKGYIRRDDDEQEALNLSLNSYNDLQVSKNSIEAQINELDKQLVDFDQDEIAQQKVEQQKLKTKRDSLFSDKNETSTNYERARILLLEKEGTLKQKEESQEIMDKYDLTQRYIEKSINLLETKITDKKDVLQYKLTNSINIIANRLVRDDLEIEIDSNLKPKVKFKSGASDKSTGQNALISIAYLFALIEVSKLSIDELSSESAQVSYPLILDGITAPLDEGHTYNAIKDFYDYEGQVIFLTNSKEVKVVLENLKTAGDMKPEDKIQLLSREKNSDETKVIKG